MKKLLLTTAICTGLALTACQGRKGANQNDSAAGAAPDTTVTDSLSKGAREGTPGTMIDSGKNLPNGRSDSTLNGGGSGPSK